VVPGRIPREVAADGCLNDQDAHCRCRGLFRGRPRGNPRRILLTAPPARNADAADQRRQAVQPSLPIPPPGPSGGPPSARPRSRAASTSQHPPPSAPLDPRHSRTMGSFYPFRPFPDGSKFLEFRGSVFLELTSVTTAKKNRLTMRRCEFWPRRFRELAHC
jgi:hypothetical protein